MRRARVVRKKAEEPSGLGAFLGVSAIFGILVAGLAPLVLAIEVGKNIEWAAMYDEFNVQFEKEIRIVSRAFKELVKAIGI
jgi:hypothetical protein